MPNQTPNLNLTKPLQTEYYNIDVHNANSDIIDTAIGSMNTDKSDKLTAGSGIILTKDAVKKEVNVAIDPTYPANKLANALTINGQQFDGSIAKEITGLATDSSVDTKISNHNTDSSAHANIVSNLESELSTKVNTIDLGFSMLYPNGGSSASPANVAVNSRYVCNNPFPGYHVLCIAEILYGGKWCITGWLFSGGASGYGVMASHLLPEDKIIVKTGNVGLSSAGPLGGTGNDMILGDVTTAQPCRVKVWKVGGKIG